ncbi:MAG: hypothetical protein AAGA42_10560 [Actinomycetota bacterium]
MRSRIPWERVETFPGTDAALVQRWATAVADAGDDAELAHALVGRAVASYWAAREGVLTSGDVTSNVAATTRAVALARQADDVDLLAAALLGVLYTTWGPEQLSQRPPILAELASARAHVNDEELRLRILEWLVLDRLDHADLDNAAALVEQFTSETATTELVVFRRREVLWRGCIAMLEGRIDEAVAINQDAISRWADVSGSPFSFQNVAITVAIERFFRRGLGDVVDAVRSIRASSPRVATNWDIGLAFTLSESGELDESRRILREIAANGFAVVPRDLNWLVTMQLCGLIALTLDEADAGRNVLDLLRPFVGYDGTHGSGYASYGPVARVVASLAGRWGDVDEAEQWFDVVVHQRPSGPWASLARYDRAVMRAPHRPTEALADVRQAASELRSYDMEAWAERADALELELLRAGHGEPMAELTDAGWRLQHPAGTATIATGVGASYLLTLLAAPHQRVELAQLDPGAPSSSESRGTVTESSLDQHARATYQRRLAELDALGQPSARERDEAEYLRRELAGARYFVATSAEVERARIRVTKAIRRSIAAVSQTSAGLGEHLDRSISTGRSCSYDPVDGAAWLIRG